MDIEGEEEGDRQHYQHRPEKVVAPKDPPVPVRGVQHEETRTEEEDVGDIQERDQHGFKSFLITNSVLVLELAFPELYPYEAHPRPY